MSDLPYSDPSNPALPSPLFSDITAVRGDHMRANNAAIFADLIELNARNPELVALTSGSFKTAALANANTYNGRSLFTCTAGVSDTPSAGAWRIFGFWNPTDSSGRFVAMADTSLETWEINYSGAAWGAWTKRAGESIHDISADYTITDTDGYSIINVDPSARKVTVTLPTLADNLNRKIQIIVGTVGGDVVIDGEGSETINGLASILLGGQYDNLTIIGCATEWRILSGRASIDTGFINTNDWTNRHLGSSWVTYDGLSGTFVLGETITEATSGNTGIIIYDSGTFLILKNVTGTGIFTNDRQITGGTSGATANVNEATSNKNKDTSVIHNFGYGIQRIRSYFYVSEDKTEAKTYYLPSAPWWYTNAKQTMMWGADAIQYRLQSGDGTILIINDNGTHTDITTQDWYYKVITEVVW